MRREAGLLALAGAVLTLGMWERGIAIVDAAPFLDALTTAISVVAQWLLTRRHVENWLLWIAADHPRRAARSGAAGARRCRAVRPVAAVCLRGLAGWRAIYRQQAGRGLT